MKAGWKSHGPEPVSRGGAQRIGGYRRAREQQPRPDAGTDSADGGLHRTGWAILMVFVLVGPALSLPERIGRQDLLLPILNLFWDPRIPGRGWH
jgi:hypothetical protein